MVAPAHAARATLKDALKKSVGDEENNIPSSAIIEKKVEALKVDLMKQLREEWTNEQQKVKEETALEQQKLREEVEEYKKKAAEQAETLSQSQFDKVRAIISTEFEVAYKEEAKKKNNELKQLQKQVTAAIQRIQELEEKMEKMHKKEEQQGAAATAAAAVAANTKDFTGELAAIQADLKMQKSTLDTLSNQHCSYDSVVKEVKEIGSKVAAVERGVADSSNRAAATAERQEMIRVLPSVVVSIPKGGKADAIAAIDEVIGKGMEDAEKKKLHMPKDMSFGYKPFGNRRGEGGSNNSSSSSGGSKPTAMQTEKLLVNFMSPEAAAFFVKNKRKLPAGIYAEPLLTAKEQKEKSKRFATYKELKAKGRNVTWHRATLVEFDMGQGKGAGRWREVTIKAETQVS